MDGQFPGEVAYPESRGMHHGRCHWAATTDKNPVENGSVDARGTNRRRRGEVLSNASLGLNAWWRWGVGITGILLVWLRIGGIPWLVACQYLRQADTLNFSCDGVTISGDSLVPEFVLSFYPFVIGIIGVWLAVRLLHRKTLTQVVTGRATFDYNRVLYSILVGSCLYLGWFVIG